MHSVSRDGAAPARPALALPPHVGFNGVAKPLSRPDNHHARTDSFREIRTRLLALAEGRNFVTLVVPVSPGSGGSYVARHLALAFAFDEARAALLIDCNFDRPSQHTAFGVDAIHGGLIDHLERPAREAPPTFYETGIPRMRLLPAGTAREAGIEYFSTYRMRALIDSLRSAHPDRYLVLDGPALRGSADARLLAGLADFVVVVAAYGRDSAGRITQAVAGLDAKKIAGVVFNCPP
jgi:Mrp family chromosome partitioning ATPase